MKILDPLGLFFYEKVFLAIKAQNAPIDISERCFYECKTMLNLLVNHVQR